MEHGITPLDFNENASRIGRVLLTGATGFIGRHVAERLRSARIPTRFFVRDPDRICSGLTASDELFVGNIESYGEVESAVKGCTHAVHLAALAVAWVRDPRSYDRANTFGTANLLRACREEGIRRVIYTSSLSACDVPTDSVNDETSIRISDNAGTEYGRSKARAARLIEAYRRGGMDIITLYPTRLFGGWKMADSNTAGVILRSYAQGQSPFVVTGGRQIANWEFVKDVADGAVRALLSAGENEEYILGGENRSLLNLCSLIDEMTGKTRPIINAPSWIATAVAWEELQRSRIFRINPLVTPDWLPVILNTFLFSSSKAERDLGYVITPIREALQDIISWAATGLTKKGEAD